MKNAIFWDVTPCGCCKNRCLGEMYRLHHQGDKNRRARNNVSSNQQPTHGAKKYCVSRLLVTANAVPSPTILVTLMMEAIRSSETSVPHGVTPQKTACFISSLSSLIVRGQFHTNTEPHAKIQELHILRFNKSTMKNWPCVLEAHHVFCYGKANLFSHALMTDRKQHCTVSARHIADYRCCKITPIFAGRYKYKRRYEADIEGSQVITHSPFPSFCHVAKAQ
jgi:hypothetical protein